MSPLAHVPEVVAAVALLLPSEDAGGVHQADIVKHLPHRYRFFSGSEMGRKRVRVNQMPRGSRGASYATPWICLFYLAGALAALKVVQKARPELFEAAKRQVGAHAQGFEATAAVGRGGALQSRVLTERKCFDEAPRGGKV